MIPDPQIQDLAARGRERAVAREHADQERAVLEGQKEKSAALRIARISMTWLGEYWPKDRFEMVGWPVLMFAVPWVFPVPMEYKLTIGLSLIGLYLAAMAFAWVLGGGRFRKELAWLAALPFSVGGYVESLGDNSGRISAPNVTGKSVGVRFRIGLKGAPVESLENIFRGFDSRLELKAEKEGMFTATLPDFLSGPSNYPLHQYFHRMAEQVLVPLARTQTIDYVNVRLNTPRNKSEEERQHMEEIFREAKEQRENRPW